MSTSVSDERDASRDSGLAPEEPVVVSMRGRASRPRRALRPGIWDHRRDFRARGGSGLYRAASTMELSKPLASAVHLQTMSRAHFIKSQIVGRPVSHRSAFVEDVIALIVVILTLAVLTCLAAIAPAVWTFATAAAGIVYCGRTFAVFVHQGRPRDVSSVKTSSRDDLRRAPVFAGVRRRSRSDRAPSAADAVCDVPANSCRKNWELTE